MRDPMTLVSQMSDVQRRVWDDAKLGAADAAAWADQLAESNGDIVDSTLQDLAVRHGCRANQVDVGGRVTETVERAAADSAASIVNTYNYDLARAILQIGEATPTANYRTYRTRLLGDTPNSIYAGLDNWGSQAGTRKMVQIATTETNTAINMITQQFYRRNSELDGQAFLLPLTAACPICQAGVDGNPYRSVRAVYQAGPWPAHPECVHYPKVQTAQAGDCSEMWLGG